MTNVTTTAKYSNHTTVASTTPAHDIGSWILAWINSIFDKIPLPRWAIYTLFGVGVFLLILLIICCCCCCCKKKKKKEDQKGKQNIKLDTFKNNVPEKHVQPNVPGAKQNLDLWKLLYSVEYSFHLEEITITVKQAVALKAIDSGDTTELYVVVYLTNNTDKNKTSNKSKTEPHKTLNPVFNESFTFKLPKSEIPDTAIMMQVYHAKSSSKHDVIGEVRVDLQELNLQHVIEESRKLEAVSEYEKLGDICISLKYNPVTSKLVVVILEGRKLKQMDKDGMSDPFVKVQLVLDKKKWKRKKTGKKKNTLNPYFNEEFSFEVTLEQIQNLDLIISVWDHDKVQKNRQIGRVTLGCRASRKALQHWSDMRANPGKSIAQWHALKPADEEDKMIQGLKSAVKKLIPRR